MSRPWLSVVMPTFNGAAYLPHALASLSACADPGVELVAVDDGSTDETVSLLEGYGENRALHLIRQEHGGNWVASSNRGLAAARGEYVCFLHQDDAWLPGRSGVLRSLTAAHPEQSFFVHPAVFIGPRGDRLGRWRCPFAASRGHLPAGVVVEKLLIQNCFAMPAPLFRRDAVGEGGMDERLWYTADWDLWLRLATRAGAVYHPQPLAAFRLHDQSQTARRTADVTALRWQLETVLDRHLGILRGGSRVAAVESAARLSVECNLWLAACQGGRVASPGPLVRAVAAAGPSGLARYVRASGIIERTLARVRVARQAIARPRHAGCRGGADRPRRPRTDPAPSYSRGVGS